LVLLSDLNLRKPAEILLTILDTQSLTNSLWKSLVQGRLSPEQCAGFRQQMQSRRAALAFFAPRLVEPFSGTRDPKKLIQIRRRFMLLGQTLDGMRVWDIRAAVQAVRSLKDLSSAQVCLAT
jgi:hypothetical protein